MSVYFRGDKTTKYRFRAVYGRTFLAAELMPVVATFLEWFATAVLVSIQTWLRASCAE
jgi:hypothetical protein